MAKIINYWISFLIFMQMIIPRIRVYFGYCPACNSDSPEIYDCKICLSYSTLNLGKFPPEVGIKKKWLADLKREMKIKYNFMG